jgi:hypothetical protein
MIKLQGEVRAVSRQLEETTDAYKSAIAENNRVFQDFLNTHTTGGGKNTKENGRVLRTEAGQAEELGYLDEEARIFQEWQPRIKGLRSQLKDIKEKREQIDNLGYW